MNEVTLDATAELSHAVSASSPCGPPLDWDTEPDLVWVATEIDRSTAIPPVPIDWPGVIERCERWLTQSKDWVLFCATARAMVHVQGVGALPASIHLLAAAIEAFWPHMHPTLRRGLTRRANYLTWFVDGVAEGLSTNVLDGGTRAHLIAAAEQLAGLDDLLRPLMGPTGYPGVRALKEALKASIDATATSPDGPARVTGRTESAPTVAVPTVIEFPPPIDDVDTADRVLSKVREALFAAADALQKADVAAPGPFRLRRMAAWLRVDVVTSSEDGKLPVPGPDAEKSARLRSALDTDHKGVLEETESLLKPFPLWLDANYLAFLALGRSGPAYKDAGNAVRAETLGLLRRLPNLLELDFSNDVPLASPDTREWLEAEIAKASAPPVATDAVPSATEERGQLAAAERTADELASQGNLNQSFKVLDDGIREAPSGRERFQWRLAAGRHAARHGRPDLALNLLDGLDSEAKDLRLDVWEPDLWAQVLMAFVDLGKKGRRERLGPELLERLPDVERRLARLDLMAAVRVTKERA